MKQSVTIDYAGRPLTISTGEMAKQAGGSVVMQYADTVVLVTAVAQKKPSDRDFLPLTVNYQEMAYAAGKFPGGFFKREGRPSAGEVLSSRLIDRPIRPLFPKGYRHETQVIATVLSVDQESDPSILGIVGASCALTVSEIPWEGPLAGVKIGRKDGILIVNPTAAEMGESDLDIVIAGTKDAIMMVEGMAKFATEADLLDAIQFGHQQLIPIIEMQEQLREKAGPRKKWVIQVKEAPEGFKAGLRSKIENPLLETFAIGPKLERGERQSELFDTIAKDYPDMEPSVLYEVYDDITRDVLREQLLSTGKRIDGRAPDGIRPINCQVGLLPRTHGSALFTRGRNAVPRHYYFRNVR